MFGKKRLLIAASGLTALGAAGAMVAGVTFGLFSSTAAPQANNFAAGTVTLASVATHTCAVTPMSPGDGTTAGGGTSNNATEVQCQYTVNYSGSVPAWLGLDVAIASTAAGPATPQPNYGGAPLESPLGAPGLYDGTANGLQVLIKDNQGTPVTYMSGTTLGGVATPTTGAASATDLLVSTSPFTGSVEFTVDYNLPITADNSYQGAASSITLTAHAAQASNNPVGSCIAGLACSTINWS